MKKWIAFVLAMMLVLIMVGCSSNDLDVAGRQYTYENEGVGGAFSITIREDGTFTYYEGLLSSYIGAGTWSVRDSVLTLSDDDEIGYSFVNHFRIRGGDLVFIEEDSDNFLYVTVKDGEVFHGEPIPADEP